jgi:exopolyphosphatase/guanosine-5'-triphosphate,3'-diphosphate pyrophosphatase
MSSAKSAQLRPIAAVVDLGTNAARLAAASLDASGALVSEGRWRELIRLGEGVEATGRISDGAMARGFETLKRFSRLIEEMRADRVDALATSALREASNAGEFLAGAREMGIPLRVISAEEEARLALAGVLASMGECPAGAVVFDIGGGSLELIQSRGGRVSEMASLRAGVVYLTERHLGDIPTPPLRVASCADDVRTMLGTASLNAEEVADLPLIGCGGAVALAWFIREGDAGDLGNNGTILGLDEIENWIGRFAALDMAGRSSLPGFEPGREDVALAGLIVLGEVLRWAGQISFRVSTGGVREGRLIELLSP